MSSQAANDYLASTIASAANESEPRQAGATASVKSLSSAQLADIVDSFPDGVLLLDRDDHIVATNRRLSSIFGSASAVVEVGMSMTDLVEKLAAHGAHYSELPANVIVMREGQRQVIRMPETGASNMSDHRRAVVRRMALHQAAPCDYEEIAPNGRWLQVSTRLTSDGGRIVCYRDITERKVRERHLEHSILHDPTTGLPNATLFRDRVNQSLRRCVRDRKHRFAVVLVDLAGRHGVERGLPFSPGEDALIAAARRLEHQLRPDDTVAHLQGSLFACLLDGIAGIDDAREISQRIQTSLREPLVLGKRELVLAPALGVVMGDGKSSDVDDLIRGASVAVDHARHEMAEGVALFDTAMRNEAETRLRIDNDLRQALKNCELDLYYQPVVNLRERRLAGFEALARWNHPEHGPIPPDQFIAIAEDTDLINPLGRWALDQAAAQIAKWASVDSNLFVAVNISPRQFIDHDLVGDVRAAIERHGINPANLRLEVTETFVVENPEIASMALDELRAMGLRISIDDFGAGYTSLGHLHTMPYDCLKIDRSFISGMENKRGNRIIVQSITELAHKIGMTVVAEGVETDAQRVLAEAFGCDFGQGYLLGRPLTSERATDLAASSEPIIG
jgi:diguanylate cyclase (GGDEF)-like protein